MYTFLINEDNTVTASMPERIMERSKMVDSLHFLAEPTYKDIDMSQFTLTMKYLLPISKRYKTETLVLSENLYKNRLEYCLPFDTNLTIEPGDIEFMLTFTNVDMDEMGRTTQYVRHVGPGTIKIIPVSAWTDVIPDDALSALDQRLLAADALLKSLNERNNAIMDSKADNLSYKNELLQLTSNGKAIGNAIKITTDSVETEDGTIRVVEF